MLPLRFFYASGNPARHGDDGPACSRPCRRALLPALPRSPPRPPAMSAPPPRSASMSPAPSMPRSPNARQSRGQMFHCQTSDEESRAAMDRQQQTDERGSVHLLDSRRVPKDRLLQSRLSGFHSVERQRLPRRRFHKLQYLFKQGNDQTELASLRRKLVAAIWFKLGRILSGLHLRWRRVPGSRSTSI
jgi:hypothetical protein